MCSSDLDFINNIGNLANRLTFLHKSFDGELLDAALSAEQQAYVDGCKADLEEITASLEAVKLRDALRQILALGNRGNKFVQDSQPWAQIKENPALAQQTCTLAAYTVRALAVALAPYMPETSERILGFMNLPAQTWADAFAFSGLHGHKIGKPEILYHTKDLKPEIAEKWRKTFSGDAPDFSRFQIKVGRIDAVSPHPDAAHLYVMTVSLGDGAPVTIVAGLTKHYTADELTGRKVMVLANLAPADLRGVASQGMVLACEKRNKLELLDATPFAVGSLSACHGVTGTDEELAIDTFKGAPFRVEDGKVTFDGEPVTVEGVPVGTLHLTSGKVK